MFVSLQVHCEGKGVVWNLHRGMISDLLFLCLYLSLHSVINKSIVEMKCTIPQEYTFMQIHECYKIISLDYHVDKQKITLMNCNIVWIHY